MHMMDMFIQLFFFIIIIALIVGLIFIFVSYRNKSRRLDRIENKLDEVLSEKENPK